MSDRYFIGGQLEVDPNRGVLYFHSDKGKTVLRIHGLAMPVPDPEVTMLDISLKTNPAESVRKFGEALVQARKEGAAPK